MSIAKPDHVSETFLFEINKAQLICENCDTIKTFDIVSDQQIIDDVNKFRSEHFHCKDD